MNNNYEEEIEVLDGLDEDEEIDVIETNQFDENKLIDDMLTPVSIEDFAGEYEDNTIEESETVSQHPSESSEIKEEKVDEIPVVTPVLGDINISEPSVAVEDQSMSFVENTNNSVTNEEMPQEYGLGFESPEMTEEIAMPSENVYTSENQMPVNENDNNNVGESQPGVDDYLYNFNFSGEDNSDLGFTGDLGADLSQANEIVNNIENNDNINIASENVSFENNTEVEGKQENNQINEIEASEPVEITSIVNEEPIFENDDNQKQSDSNSTELVNNNEIVTGEENEEPEEELKLKNKKQKKEKKEHKVKPKTVVFIILVILLIAAFAVLVPTLLENMI